MEQGYEGFRIFDYIHFLNKCQFIYFHLFYRTLIIKTVVGHNQAPWPKTNPFTPAANAAAPVLAGWANAPAATPGTH